MNVHWPPLYTCDFSHNFMCVRNTQSEYRRLRVFHSPAVQCWWRVRLMFAHHNLSTCVKLSARNPVSRTTSWHAVCAIFMNTFFTLTLLCWWNQLVKWTRRTQTIRIYLFIQHSFFRSLSMTQTTRSPVLRLEEQFSLQDKLTGAGYQSVFDIARQSRSQFIKKPILPT